ncbi:hypothetical protein BGZ72_002144, partial [Mortierella alpina]
CLFMTIVLRDAITSAGHDTQPCVKVGGDPAQSTTVISTAIDDRDFKFASDTRQIIRSILETPRSRVTLDHLVLDDDNGQPYAIDEPEEILGETLHYFRDVWHAHGHVAILFLDRAGRPLMHLGQILKRNGIKT